MPVWKTASVDEQPIISLECWWIFRVPSLDEQATDDHFCGYNPGPGFFGGEGRVSSKIVEWDSERMIGTTRSGRKYLLIGEPLFNADASYVYKQWLRLNNVDEDAVVDVTDEYLNNDNQIS